MGDDIDHYYQDPTGVTLSPRDWAALRATDGQYSYRRDPPTLDRPTVDLRYNFPPPICAKYRDVGPDIRGQYTNQYPFQLRNSDEYYKIAAANQPDLMANLRPLGGYLPVGIDGCRGFPKRKKTVDAMDVLMLVILFLVVTAIGFTLGIFAGMVLSKYRSSAVVSTPAPT